MSAPNYIVAYTRHVVDRHAVPDIAKDMGITEDQVRTFIEIESKRRGLALKAPPTWKVLAEEQRVCDMHGPFLAQQQVLDPQPVPIPGSAVAVAFPLKPFWTQCPTCDRFIAAEQDQRDIRTNALRAEQALQMRMQVAGVPRGVQEATVAKWQHPTDAQKTCWRWAMDYVKNVRRHIEDGTSCVFLGNTGTGKTMLAAALVREVLSAGGTAQFTTVLDMLSRIKATFVRDSRESEMSALRIFTSPDLLVLDEVGRSLDSGYEQTTFFRVLDSRYNDRKSTIIVSNLGAANFRTFLGDAVVDRLRHNGGKILTFDWGSYRSRRKPGGDEESGST